MAKINFDTNKLANTTNDRFSKLVRKVILDGMNKVIRQNPVDTGRSKANWSTSISTIKPGIKEPLGAKTPINSLSSLPDYIASTQRISTYKLGQTAFLHNNVEYIVGLEYGSSKQAPAGWIRNTAKEMQNQFDKIKNIL